MKRILPLAVFLILIFSFVMFCLLARERIAEFARTHEWKNNFLQLPHFPQFSSRVDSGSTDSGEYVPVLRVVDGDTIDVLLNGTRARVRLIGVDTPETVDPRRPVGCFGKEASNETARLLSEGRVRIVRDPSQGEYDKYDRLLAYLYTPDGTFLNRALIANGFAHEYTYHTPYQFQSEFKSAEASARTQHLGLWAQGVCP